MPCRDDQGEYYDAIRRKEEKAYLDKLTAMLCGVLTKLKADHYRGDLPHEVQVWWKAHQAADRKREAAETQERYRANMKRNALMKLTTEEKKALGLNTTKF